MVKVILDWERSGSGHGMLNNLDDENNEKRTQEQVYEFVDGDDRKSFLHECPAHVLYLWHLAYKCTLSDNNFGLDQVLMVMLDQVLIQSDL